MPFLDNGLFYRDQGDGGTLLFVHGWCMSSDVWELQFEALSDSYRVVALDLNGHGRSATSQNNRLGFDRYADDILYLANQLDLKDIVAVGWSMGAQVLFRAYVDLRERLSGIVLVGATPRFTSAPHFSFGLHPDEARGMALKVRRNLERALDGFRSRMFADGELDDPLLSSRINRVLKSVVPPSSEAALDGLESLMDEELLEEASMINLPTLVLHGELDRICRPEASLWLESAIAGSRRICYSGCGHAPFLSEPDRFNADLSLFAQGVFNGC